MEENSVALLSPEHWHVRGEQEPCCSSLPINIEYLEVYFSLTFVTSLSKRRAMGFFHVFKSCIIFQFCYFVIMAFLPTKIYIVLG